MACTMSLWHERQAASVTRWLRAVIWMLSGKRPDVNANECQNPLRALVEYFPKMSCGVWQSLQTATV
jgi:hypothetical protein